MTSSRQAIFSAIRHSLERGSLSECQKSQLNDRVHNPSPGLIPSQGRAEGEVRIQQFIDQARAETATVQVLEHRDQVPQAVASYLRQKGCDPGCVLSPDQALTSLDWDTQSINWRSGLPDRNDLTAVTTVYAGIAETGTLCLISGPNSPYSLNLLPDNHIAVLSRSRIVASYEACWDLIRSEMGQKTMPRTLLWVTGPSMTGDIEQTLLRGAHGPRSLHILLV